MEDRLYLGFVRLIGQEIDDFYTYELIFTEHPNSFWGENFEYKPCGLCNSITPDQKYVDKLVKIKTSIKFGLIQNSLCFGFQDCADGIVALAYEDIDDYDEYPNDGRLVLMFGEDYDEVEKKLARKKIFFSDF